MEMFTTVWPMSLCSWPPLHIIFCGTAIILVLKPSCTLIEHADNDDKYD